MLSSPVKPSKQTNAEGLTTAEERVRHSKHAISTNIHLRHCPRQPPPPLRNKLQSLARVVARAETAKVAYTRIARLLNLISEDLFSATAALQSQSPHPALIFTLSYNKPLTGDYLDTREKPDLVGFMGTKAELDLILRKLQSRKPAANLPPPPAWAANATVLEDKRNNPDIWQIASYCRNLKRYRPDLKLVYGLSIEKSKFTVLSSDASVTCKSVQFKLTSVSGLYNYVQAVYTSIIERDPVLCATPGLDGQVWSVHSPSLPKMFAPFYVGHARGKMTWVGIESTDQPRHILKMSWQDERRRFRESAMYALVHAKDKWLPGVARPTGYLSFDKEVVGNRKKGAVVLESLGKPLSECGTVTHLLETIFDGVQVLEQMNRRGVLHRDVSWFNVLCHPNHKESELGEFELETIGKVMQLDDRTCRVLIVDLDNAAQIDPNEGIAMGSGERAERTGTPMFIPIAISIGVHDTVTRTTLQELTDLYVNLMVQLPEPYTNFEQRELLLVTTGLDKLMDGFTDESQRLRLLARGGQTLTATSLPHPRKDPDLVHHLPHHDIESLFWSLLWTVVRSQSAEDERMEPDSNYEAFCKTMLEHTVGGDEVTRLAYRQEKKWSRYLHPSLAVLAGMLSDIGTYLSIDWPASIELPVNHAHVVMKRLLLQQLIKLSETNPIPVSNIPRYFDFEKARTRGMNVSTMYSTGAASKRPAPDDTPPRRAKRRRTAAAKQVTADSDTAESDHEDRDLYLETDASGEETDASGEETDASVREREDEREEQSDRPQPATTEEPPVSNSIPAMIPDMATLESISIARLFQQPDGADGVSASATAFRTLHWQARTRWFGRGV